MIKITLVSFCLILLALCSSAQNSIQAKNAINHIGEQVFIVDSIYNVKVYNDSTAVIDLGGKGNQATLNVILNSKSNIDANFLRTFKDSKLSVTGFVVLIEDQPAIILTDKQNLKFLSNSTNQKWLSIAQLSHKKQ